MTQPKPHIDTTASIYGKFAIMANEHIATNFTQGAPDFDTPEWLIARTNFYMQKGKNQYSPIPVAPALRKAIVQKSKVCYYVDIEIDNVAITAGAQEGLFAAISCYVDKDD